MYLLGGSQGLMIQGIRVPLAVLCILCVNVFLHARSMKKRPLTVTIIGWLLIAVGVGASAFHLNELRQNAFHGANAWIFIVELVVIVCGVFVLRGNNWARWLAVVWIGAHVIISFLNSWGHGAVHVLILFLLTCFLFRPESNAFFRNRTPNDL